MEVESVDALRAHIGRPLGSSDWVVVDQAMIDRFAEATGDHQWIHVDPEKAAQTPFGGTIAHGLFTLSIGPRLSYALYTIEGVAFALNYGYEKVRFPAPLPVGKRVRMRATLAKVDDVAGGVQMQITQTFEVDGGEKPCCVAEQLVRVFPG